MQPLISIIIPVYNHAHTIERCLRSIEAQTYRTLEIIIVNDGSTDNFKDVIEKIKLEIPIKILEQENRGATVARNRGFRESTGEYVIFWDADTIAQPEMLEKLERALEVNREAAYAYCRFKFGWKIMKSQPFNSGDLKQYNFIDTTSLIRRSVFIPYPYACPPKWREGEGRVRSNWPFDESLSRFQDWDLWLTLLEQGRTGVFVPEVLFRKMVAKKNGISGAWLAVFLGLHLPWQNKKAREYHEAREKIMLKHNLSSL